jgi:glycosyltransferase involved in cell wall biosynthesis
VYAEMIRIVQLLEHPSDFQTARSIEHLAAGLGERFSVATRAIGRVGDWSGIPAAVRGLRRMVEEPADVIHAWGIRALMTAVLAGGGGRIAYTPAGEFRVRSINWLRAAMSQRPVEVVCATATQRRIHVERGIPLNRCHTIRPGLDFARVRRRRDPQLRAALGFGANDYVVMVPGESTPAASHHDAVWATSILHVLDARWKLLLWGRGMQIGQLERFGGGLDQPDLLSTAERRLGRPVEPEELLPAADMVLVTARGITSTLPVAICMAAALPIVSAVTYTLSELLEDRHTALLVGERSPRAIARRMLDMRADAGLQWRVSDMARTEAYEYFSLSRFLQQYRQTYEQVAAGSAVRVIEPAPGAGLRFHGRG